MAYVKYTGLTTANSILAQMSIYASSVGWTVEANCIDDLDVILRSLTDGKRLTLRNPSATFYAHLRSANGYQIFPKQDGGVDITTATALPAINSAMTGIGLICSSGWSSVSKWYAQDNAPTYSDVNGNGAQVGVGIQTREGSQHTLYCNSMATPEEMIIFTIECGGLYQHLAFGNIHKLATWTGGMMLSGTLNSYNMFTGCSGSILGIEANMSPLFSTDSVSTSFLRIDMGDAPTRGDIGWASSGSNDTTAITCYTGKQLALPIRTAQSIGSATWIPQIPNYRYLQSQSTTDSGDNCNTLNCITIDLPLYAAVIVDPDDLHEFAPVGIISGVACISMYNMAEGETYEISYPSSGVLHQVFPHTRNGGVFGYDGISLVQT